jgi:hypothetical protein
MSLMRQHSPENGHSALGHSARRSAPCPDVKIWLRYRPPAQSSSEPFPLPSGCRKPRANEGNLGEGRGQDGNRKAESFPRDRCQVRVSTQVLFLAQFLFKSRPPRKTPLEKSRGVSCI